MREIKLRPKIADHDYETKKGHVERFLRQQDKVKVTIMFRGREQAHPERGRALLQRLYDDISETWRRSSRSPSRRAATCTCCCAQRAARQQQRDGGKPRRS